MKRTHDGYCNFGGTDGKTHFVTWTVVTADDPGIKLKDRRKYMLDGGKICYLELSVDGETKAAFDNGTWVKRPVLVMFSVEDRIASRFMDMLTNLYK